MDALALEAAEEVFSDGVVIGIALAGHALADAKIGKPLAVSAGGVLQQRTPTTTFRFIRIWLKS